MSKRNDGSNWRDNGVRGVQLDAENAGQRRQLTFERLPVIFRVDQTPAQIRGGGAPFTTWAAGWRPGHACVLKPDSNRGAHVLTSRHDGFRQRYDCFRRRHGRPRQRVITIQHCIGLSEPRRTLGQTRLRCAPTTSYTSTSDASSTSSLPLRLLVSSRTKDWGASRRNQSVALWINFTVSWLTLQCGRSPRHDILMISRVTMPQWTCSSGSGRS